MTYRKIDTAIWSDSEVIELSPNGRFAYMYLLTAPQGTLSGCFECSAACMARDTGMSGQDAAAAMRELMQRDLVAHDQETNEVLLSNWGAHQWSRSPRLAKALEKSISKIKSDALRSRAAAAFEAFTGIPYRYGMYTVSDIGYAYGIDTVCDEKADDKNAGEIPYRYGIDTVSDTDTESESPSSSENPIPSANSQEPEAPRGGFRREAATPSLAEIEEYAKWRGYNVDGRAFFDLNERNGWTINGERIKHWRRAFDRWVERQSCSNGGRKPPPVYLPAILRCPKCAGSSWHVAGSTYECPKCGKFDSEDSMGAIA